MGDISLYNTEETRGGGAVRLVHVRVTCLVNTPNPPPPSVMGTRSSRPSAAAGHLTVTKRATTLSETQ